MDGSRSVDGTSMSFPVYLRVGSLSIHPHWLFEALAYAVGFRVYVKLRRQGGDHLPDADRWWVIAAAAMGAIVGGKLLFLFEDPRASLQNPALSELLFSGKTIVGALIGGLFAVELAKRVMKVTTRTGDLFALPLCVGIAIGRIGCFLTGIEDHTAGVETTLPWGVNFGDGVRRHPTQLYEILFLIALGLVIWRVSRRPHVSGDLFKIFMVGYFAFRLVCDFLKPEIRVFAGLSSIQWACALMLLYYASDIVRWMRHRITTDGTVADGEIEHATSASVRMREGVTR
jgi:phosphatidylglycerol---prolipoprotein diacylglyceryl transferase